MDSNQKLGLKLDLATWQRIFAIIQLCLAFSLMLGYMAQPFMGEYFNLRSRMILYEYVMGKSNILNDQSPLDSQLGTQSKRFTQLALIEQQQVKKDYQSLYQYANRPILKKIEDGLRILIQAIPPFEQAWMFFSIILAILILLRKEEVQQAIWILPLVVLAYTIDNQLTGKSVVSSPDVILFPTEEMIAEHYVKEPLAKNIFKQKEQLEKGWNLYLIEKWSSNLNKPFTDLLEEGKFNFTLARLKLLQNQSPSNGLNLFHQKVNPLWLFIYFLWNSLFAWVVSCPLKGKNGLKFLRNSPTFASQSINH